MQAIIGNHGDFVSARLGINGRDRTDLVPARQVRGRLKSAVGLPRQPPPVFARKFRNEMEIERREPRLVQAVHAKAGHHADLVALLECKGGLPDFYLPVEAVLVGTQQPAFDWNVGRRNTIFQSMAHARKDEEERDEADETITCRFHSELTVTPMGPVLSPRNQCRKCRTPVTIIAIPRRSAASMTS